MLSLRRYVSQTLERRAIRLHRSRIGWRQAPAYSHYLTRCQREAPAEGPQSGTIGAAVDNFRREGISSFWTNRTGSVARAVSDRIAQREQAGEVIWKATENGYYEYLGDPWIDHPELEQLFEGDLGSFLNAYYRSAFKLLYGSLYRTEYAPSRTGSQLWHSDGGPGICVNVMFYLNDVTPAHGALEGLPWDHALALFQQEKRMSARGQLSSHGGAMRDSICAFYEQAIEARYKNEIRQPIGAAGLVVPFLNNIIHRGGYPAEGLTRTAIVFHCYPSHRPTDLGKYRLKGIRKTMPYPRDPAADF